MSRIADLGAGYWSVRGDLRFLGGFVQIGTHMALVRLSSGKFLVIDTCGISTEDKAVIDDLTNNGELIEAVVATHPFHTLFFAPFFKWYPNTQYYGTPRHIKRITDIPWAGSMTDEAVLRRWEGDGIFMRIPAGAEFENPAESNHFSGILVYHQPSRTLFSDDTVMFFVNPGFLLRCAAGARHMGCAFWDLKKGLKPTKEAPAEFEAFIRGVLADWDFDNICAAHTGNLIGGAKKVLIETLEREKKTLDKLAASHK